MFPTRRKNKSFSHNTWYKKLGQVTAESKRKRDLAKQQKDEQLKARLAVLEEAQKKMYGQLRELTAQRKKLSE
jgi:hypothetical protein